MRRGEKLLKGSSVIPDSVWDCITQWGGRHLPAANMFADFCQASSLADVTHTNGILRTRQCPFYRIKKALGAFLSKKGSVVLFVGKTLWHCPAWEGNMSWFHLVHVPLPFRCALISHGWGPGNALYFGTHRNKIILTISTNFSLNCSELEVCWMKKNKISVQV